MNPAPSDAHLSHEQAFFDREAADLLHEDLRIGDDQFERYRTARIRPSNIAKDTLFARLGSLEGKQVLNYDCGHGENACLFAACGAHVTAFDLSPLSVAVAKRRAELHGLSDRIEFDVQPAGSLQYAAGSFDIVAGQAILHHLHTELDSIYAEINRLVKPSGKTCFIEPVANSPLLRMVRRLTPVKYDTTPDERQMFYEDFEGLKAYFPKIEFHHFYGLERLHRIFGPSVRDSLRTFDFNAQRRLRFLRRYYGTLLVIASR